MPRFHFTPEWPAMESLLRDVLEHDHDSELSTNLDAFVAQMQQRDQHLEDFLAKVATGVGLGPSAPGLSHLFFDPSHQQAVSNAGTPAVTTVISWPQVDVDDIGMGTSLKAPLGGSYIIAGYIRWLPNASGQRAFYVAVNGSPGPNSGGTDNELAANEINACGGGFATCQSVLIAKRLNAGDVVSFGAIQNSGGSLNIYNGDCYIVRLGA